MNKKLWLIFGCASMIAGPKLSVDLEGESRYIVKECERSPNPAYMKMSDQDYRLVVDLIFENIDTEFRRHLFHWDQYNRSFKLGIHILNLYTQNGDDAALSILKMLIIRKDGIYYMKAKTLLKDVPFIGVKDSERWNAPSASAVRRELIERYPEIAHIIEELIPDGRGPINLLKDYVGSCWNSWNQTEYARLDNKKSA